LCSWFSWSCSLWRNKGTSLKKFHLLSKTNLSYGWLCFTFFSPMTTNLLRLCFQTTPSRSWQKSMLGEIITKKILTRGSREIRSVIGKRKLSFFGVL
jgi:hypothetical protein